MKRNLHALGSRKEEEAAVYLEQRGYRILCRNYRCRTGEIDLVAAEGGTLCFIEVKYRSSDAMGSPGEGIDARKRGRIRTCAMSYLHENHLPEETSCRFDVVLMTGNRTELIRKHSDEDCGEQPLYGGDVS